MPTSLLRRPRAGLCADRALVPLEHVSVRAEIQGACARVICTQRYRNQESRPIEAVYVFPLDEGAAVCGFAAVVDGVRFEGMVKPREEAFADYDDAMSEGHGTFLLDEERPDVFTASVGNLAPGASADIELTYVTELAIEGDAIRFTLPTTVAPRYAPPEDRVAIGRSPNETLNPPRQRDVPYGLSLSATVTAASGVRRIESPSHPIGVEIDGGRATITLAQQDAALDRDVVIVITANDVVGPQIVLERGTNGRVAAAVVFRPSFPATRTPTDIVFLVDRSGSMEGSSIEQVRNALQLCLRSLDEGCRFNIVGFGSAFESLYNECRPYDDRSLAEASAYVDSMGATLGGTNMLPALEFALQHAGRVRGILQLIVLTDGEVTNTDAVLDAIRQRARDVRVFTFGIGRGASHHLVNGLARAGRGAAEFVYPGERIESKVVRQFKRALAPALTDVTLEWNGPRATRHADIGPIFADEPLRVYAFLDQLVEGDVTLQATGPSGARLSWMLPVRPAAAIDGATIGILAARARIRELEEGEMPRATGSRRHDRMRDRAVSEIVKLAVEYGLASRETSWVAIEKRNAPLTGDAVLRKVPIALTSGWGGEDVLDATITGGVNTHRVAASNLELASKVSGLGFMDAFNRADVPLMARSAASPGWLSRLRSAMTRGPRSTPLPEDRSSSRELDRLIALQRADGSWDLDDALARVLGVPLAALERRLARVQENTDEARRAWATACALAFLERRESSSHDEWALLAAKARRWLATVTVQPPAGASWEAYAARELYVVATAGWDGESSE